MANNKRKPKTAKSKHYSLSWDVLQAVRLVEMYEAKHGKDTPLSYSTLQAIYKGDLLPAIYFKKINSTQRYGVTFTAHLTNPDGSEETVEHSIKLSEPMTLLEFFNGYEDCFVNHKGTQTYGWKGAKDYWLDIIDVEYPNSIFHSVTAQANCLVK